MEQITKSKVLHLQSTFQDTKEILENFPNTEVFPVVFNQENMTLVGAVMRSTLRRSLRKYQERLVEKRMTFQETQISKNDLEEQLVAMEQENRQYDFAIDSGMNYRDLGVQSDYRKSLCESSNNDSSALAPILSSSSSSSALFTPSGTGIAGWVFSLIPEWISHLSPRKLNVTEDERISENMQRRLPYHAVVEGRRRPVHETSDNITFGIDIDIDLSPYQVSETTHLIKLDSVFRMLKLNQAYVTKSGYLVGIVSRADLRDYIGGYEKKPIDRCLHLIQSCFGDMNSRCLEPGEQDLELLDFHTFSQKLYTLPETPNPLAIPTSTFFVSPDSGPMDMDMSMSGR